MAYDPKWREKELSIFDVIQKYPEVSPFVIIKTDAQRRGLKYTEAALERVNPKIHQTLNRSFGGEVSDKNTREPFSLLMRDGTSILAGAHRGSGEARDPLVIDVVDGKTVITDQGKVLEEVIYWEKPDFYDKFTSKGTPMWQIAWARPQRIDLNPYQDCQFWNTPGHGCKYCAIKGTYQLTNKPDFVDIDEIDETVTEALKLSGVYDKVMSLPKGIDTTLTREFDDEGAVLSGGEFQKIVVSRAFARSCPVKVFDEPSSALDPIAEYQLFDNILKACKENTLLFISHRLSSVQNADHVFLLEQGQVKEEGTHRELLDRNGLYADMYQKQAENYLADKSKQREGIWA